MFIGMASAIDLFLQQDMESFSSMREGQTEYQNLQLAAMTNNRMLSYAQLKWDESLAQTVKKVNINDEDIEDINREDEYSLSEIKDAGWGDKNHVQLQSQMSPIANHGLEEPKFWEEERPADIDVQTVEYKDQDIQRL